MVPAVRSMMMKEPWAKNQKLDWPFIRTTWKELAVGKIFVEASPPNIVRYDQIIEHFGVDSTAMLTICSPYQYIASCLRRYYKTTSSIPKITENWILKAELIHSLVTLHRYFPFLTYEDFVQNPERVNRLLNIETYPFKMDGKDGSGAVGIQDLSIRTSSFLNMSEITTINSILARHEELLGFFGYGVIDEDTFSKNLEERDPREFKIGRDRRTYWNVTRFVPSYVSKLKHALASRRGT